MILKSLDIAFSILAGFSTRRENRRIRADQDPMAAPDTDRDSFKFSQVYVDKLADTLLLGS
jgi:hypothetical protein